MDNDAAKYAQMKAELDAEDGLAPEPPRMAEEDTIVNPQPPQPQPRYEPEPLPPVDEDPIGHFQGRVTDLEGFAHQQHAQAQGRNIRDYVERSEKTAREELNDYDDAVRHLETAHRRRIAEMFPDSPHTATLAHQYGLRSPAELREAMFNRDRQSVIHQAITHGQDPAALYYQHAVYSYGYQPTTGFTKSQRQHLLDAAEEGGEAYDKLWDKYSRAERQAEQNRRSRR